MVAIASDIGYDFRVLAAVVESNDVHQHQIVERCLAMLGDSDDRQVGMWGVAFKAGTDDTRDSPALAIARGLMAQGVAVRAFDPEAKSDEVEMVGDPLEAAEGADVLMVATEWPEFLRVDFGEVAKAMRGDMVYDVRNLIDPATVRAAGLQYRGLGRPRA